MTFSRWNQRIERAEELASAYPLAAEVLGFYRKVARFQRELYADAAGAGIRPLKELNTPFLLSKFEEFLGCMAYGVPQPVANTAVSLKTQTIDVRHELLLSFWRSAPIYRPVSDDVESLLAWLFLQPYAEYLAERTEHPACGASARTCPVCSGRPLVGVLRPEGDGGKRSLVCAICATEWPFDRITCPSCGEETVERLAVFTANEWPHVRVDVCDTCRYYIKTVDLTKNGRAVPVVDELATIPLNLWAQEHQYVKLQPNLLSI
jgi:FdhE protein